jgi:hypothetical protein
MSFQYLRGKDVISGSMCQKKSPQGGVETYLVRYPDVRIRYAIQDYMPGALHVLSTAFYVWTGSDIPRGTLEPGFSQMVQVNCRRNSLLRKLNPSTVP